MTDVPGKLRTLFEHWDEAAQAGILWPRQSWVDAFPDHRDLFVGLPDRLDREHVRQASSNAATGAEQAVRAFLASMAWGYGRTGYARWRTNMALTQTVAVPERLQRVAERVATDGGLAGYDLLGGDCRVRHLGPAFGTKYLYFIPQADGQAPALILDRIVAGWLRANTSTVFNPVPWAPSIYRGYAQTLGGWAEQLGVAPDVVEELIFVASATGQWAAGRGGSLRGRRAAGPR
jgi:hypothetical protein